MKQGESKWTSAATRTFGRIKLKIIEALVPQLPNFNEVFEVTCDASKVGIGVLSPDGHPIAFYNKQLNESKKKYSTYDLEQYVVVQIFCYWWHYLVEKEFVLFSDHEALKHLQSQQKLSAHRAKWSTYLLEFTRHSTQGQQRKPSGKHLLTPTPIFVPGL